MCGWRIPHCSPRRGGFLRDESPRLQLAGNTCSEVLLIKVGVFFIWTCLLLENSPVVRCMPVRVVSPPGQPCCLWWRRCGTEPPSCWAHWGYSLPVHFQGTLGPCLSSHLFLCPHDALIKALSPCRGFSKEKVVGTQCCYLGEGWVQGCTEPSWASLSRSQALQPVTGEISLLEPPLLPGRR